ncbi:hypothetical protein FOA43_002366 [Brettanomyces nanus]|uniref:Brl1/Brr6 domain-containing protein n=1 Tax=Eeniella nana TaxID=13502 RepID=A0A875S0V3_EENNA|nr:uncharacterized protein FOA43_002366 [Brettanomyces nanus]QPG75026.1 hypothetical protein FOA43_002366 [Brettanomyces nanus]
METFRKLSIQDDYDSDIQENFLSGLSINEDVSMEDYEDDGRRDDLRSDISMEDAEIGKEERHIQPEYLPEGQLDKQLDEQLDKQLDEQLDEQLDKQLDEQLGDQNEHSVIYDVFHPTMQGCRVASGRTKMEDKDLENKNPKDEPSKDMIQRREGISMPEKNGCLSEDEYTHVSTSDGVVHRQRNVEWTDTSTEEKFEYIGAKDPRARPIFINQNNYIGTYNRFTAVKPTFHERHPVDQASKHDHNQEAGCGGPVWRKPYLISTYLQITMNTLISLYALYHIYLFLKIIRKDVSNSVDNELMESKFKTQTCYRQYHSNHCHDQNLPALQKQCIAWMKCMNKEPYMLINYSELIVAILGSLVNTFFESFSYRSISVMLLIGGILYAWNFSCGYFRAKTFYGLPLIRDAAFNMPGKSTEPQIKPSENNEQLVSSSTDFGKLD